MKLRLHRTPAECAAAAARLRRTPGLHISDESRPYPDRTGELVRGYRTAHLDPTEPDQHPRGERLMGWPDPLGPSRRVPSRRPLRGLRRHPRP